MQKQDIKTFPFEEFANLADPIELETHAKSLYVEHYTSWMLPQLVSLFGGFKVTRDEEGKVICKALLADNFGTDKYMLGIWRVVNQLPRGSLVKPQNKYPDYSALVPLIMSGLKKYQGINYMEYSAEGLQHLMPSNLYEAITTDYDNSLSSERLLELRLQGLRIATGPKAGTSEKATGRWTPKGILSTEIGRYPNLTKTMLTQLWVADPSLRTSYMILDPVNWDNMPKPLISVDVMIEEPAAPIKQKKTQELPWQ